MDLQDELKCKIMTEADKELIKNLPQGVTVTEEEGRLIFNIELPKGMTEDEATKILNEIKEKHWKHKGKLTDKSTEKPLIYTIGGCYKNYLHRPLG